MASRRNPNTSTTEVDAMFTGDRVFQCSGVPFRVPREGKHTFRRVLKLTNHSDYADPARFYLDQLSGNQSGTGPLLSHLPSPNGSGHAPSASPNQPPNQDYVL